MRLIAFVTYRGLATLSADDRLAVAALEARGVRVDAVVWDDPRADWAGYDAVVVRSCWDYHLRLDEFVAWIDRLAGEGVPLWNPAAVLRWNARKTYLRDLEARGARVVPTHWSGAGDPPSLGALLDARGWDRAVVKPVVSASAHATWVAARPEGAEGDARFRAAIAAGPVMVQPFAEAIVREGEWSFVFIAGTLSHAVLKRAAPGDFRVQAEHGGTAEARVPDPALVRDAETVLALAPAPCLYARVDGYADAGGLVLMELELLEPSLFLSLDAGAASRFADALLATIGATAPDVAGAS